MIELRSFNAAELARLVQAPEYRDWPHLPISIHRGISHAHNPRRSPDDVLLLLAYRGDTMVGYLGLLPDRLYFPEGTEKAAWLSCLWVDPAQRGQGISKKLVRRGLELYGGRILVTEFTVPAERLYDRLEAFTSLQIKEGARFYRRLDLAEILGKRGGIWAKIKGLLRGVDLLVNAVLDLRFAGEREDLGAYTWEETAGIDPAAEAFIAEHRIGEELFRREAEELNWMREYPWLVVGAPDAMSRKYVFSSVADAHSTHFVRVKDRAGKLVMLFLFLRRNGNLKVNYFYAAPGREGDAVRILRQHLRKWRVKTLLLYQPALLRAIGSGRLGSLHRRPALRKYIIGKVLADRIAGREFVIQDGDGDCGFT
ncbi:MAG: GNAT family N-acetyltransferase [Bacteroidota bacterium]